MTGTWHLLRLQWRTNRGMLLLAPALLAALVVATAAGVAELYPQAAQREGYARTMGASPAAAAFNGRGYDLGTLGGIASYEVGFMGQLAVPVVGLLMAVRLTRRLEDTGILELVTSGRVCRTAVPLAAFLSSCVAWGCLAGLGATGLALLDFPAGGSIRYLATMALLGLASTAVGLALGQAAATARSATSTGLALVLVAFLVRSVVDGRQSSLVWLSPLGWVAEARPWGDFRWWPVYAFLGLTGFGVAAALAVAARRDLGSGLLTPRLGADVAAPRLATPLGLVWRLVKDGVIGWAVGALAWAVAIGSMSQEFLDIIESNPSLAEAFGGDVTHLSTVLSLLLTTLLAIAAGLGVALRMGAEEMSGRLGLLHAGRVPRLRWWWAFTAVGLVTTVVVGLASATMLGLVQWQVMGRRQAFTDAVEAGAWLAIPAALLVALGALLAATLPRQRMLAWLPVVWAAVVGILGEMLRLPDWACQLSPLYAVGQVPVEAADKPVALGLAVACAALLALGGVGLQRRDLAAG